MNRKNLKKLETAIGIGVLCFTTLNFAMNPIPFLLVSGGAAVTRLAVAKFQQHYDPKTDENGNAREQKYKLAYSVIEKSLYFILLFLSSETFFVGYATSSISLFACVFARETVMPEIILDVSNQINDYFVPTPSKKKSTDSQSIASPKEEDNVKFMTSEIAKDFIWGSLKFFIFPGMVKAMPNVPQAVNYIALKSVSNFLVKIFQDRSLPNPMEFSTCMVDATIRYFSLEAGSLFQTISMEQQLLAPKEAAYICGFILTELSLTSIKDYFSKKQEPAVKQAPVA